MAALKPSPAVLVLALLCATTSLPAEATGQDRSIFSVLDTGGRSVAPASPADGALSDADVLSAGGRRVQVWAMTAAPGSELRVDLRSADFDAFLYVVGPGLGEGLRDDDSGEGLNARLCVNMTDEGEYRIVAASLGGEVGSFTLELSEAPGAENGECPESGQPEDITDLALLPTEGRELRVGDDVEGYLGENDPTVFDSPAQAWSVEGQAGAPFSVDLVSDAFDAYLMVEGPGLETWLQDDDGAGGCDSRLTFDFPESGTYRVVASTLDAAGGPFRLLATERPGPTDPAACSALSDADDDPVADASNVVDAGRLSWGVTANGRMTGTEGLYAGRSMQGWTLDGDAGARVSIEMRSADFDSYLYLFGPGLVEPIYDDDGAGNLHSRICVELPETGTYRVFAGPLSGEHPGGRFTLAASEDAETLCDYFEVSPERVAGYLNDLSTDGRSLTVGDEVDGLLDGNSERHPESGRFIQPWSLLVQAGQQIYVDVVSDDFDAVLYAIGAGFDEVLYADDAEGCLHSRLEILPTVSGTMTLFPGAFSADASGSFVLRASTDPPELRCDDGGGGGIGGGGETATSAEASILGSVSSGADRRIAVGTEVVGALSVTSETLTDGQPADAWTVDVVAGEEFVFELLSDDFDAVLYLDGPGLVAPLTNDDGAGGLNSRIVFAATESGTMRLVASALTESAFGSYSLRAIRRAR